ncbi:MAG: GNAT family N-acetyltransferase [Oscillatoriaceae cyanobacterium Prado104]|nr:GNAT family N-acetyltransferase [Oscillatoriaceae cyanobacterium Prado104]
MVNNSRAQVEKVAGILAECFIDDPFFDFVFGEIPNKLNAYNGFFELFIADAMERGKCAIAPEEQGACVWYPAGVEIFNDRFEQILVEVVALVSRFAGEKSGKRYENLIQKMGGLEPTETHCEVFFIGLKPPARGKGIGKSLLQTALDCADTKRVGCYLVSSNPRNISFYKRHNFQELGAIELSATYSMTGMWRDFAN